VLRDVVELDVCDWFAGFFVNVVIVVVLIFAR
jgi:hypothetical protein